MKIRKVLAVILSLSMIFALAQITFASQFKDVRGHAYYTNAVDWASANGITKGYADGTFRPEQKCERREMLIFLWRLAGEPQGEGDPAAFTDMKPYSLETDTYKAAAWGIGEGIIKGYGDGTFRPTESVSRKDALIMFYRTAGCPEVTGDISYPDVIAQNYAKDSDSWRAILWAENEGITKGYADGTFRPLADCLREHIITFLYRGKDAIKEKISESVLIAGAGMGTIDFPEEMYPMSEGFIGVDQAPHVRVVLLENAVKIAIVAIEQVNTPADLIAQIQEMIEEKAGIPKGNVWVSSTHAFCTPHAPNDAENLARFNKAILDAAKEAVSEAADGRKEARFGTTTAYCDINVNHERKVGEKWIDSTPNPERPSDKTVTVMKVEDSDGKDIAILFSYGIRSSAADAPRGSDDRLITPDLSGEASLALEEEYGVPALFLNSAAADQMPKEAGLWNQVSEDGTSSEQIWNGIEAGLAAAKKMGSELAAAVKGAVDTMECIGKGEITHYAGSFNWDNTTGDAQINVPVETITIDGLAMAAVKTELCAETALALREASPYENTIALTFVNGDQSYMPAASTYDEGTKVSTKSSLKKGAAEEFISVAVDMLNRNFLLAGAGMGTIDFPEEMYPMSEGFIGVDQAPHVRVLLLQHDIKTAIVAVEQVNTPADVIDAIKEQIAQRTGTPKGNIWVSSTHAFCTPHAPTDAENLARFNAAVLSAAEEAIDQASDDLQYAKIGIAETTCDINVNHERKVGEKWIDSTPNPDRPSDKTVTIVKVQSLEGNDIGLMFSYGIRSSAADAPRGNNERLITPDLSGEASLALEKAYGVPALFLNSAAADQMPKEAGLWNKVSEDGSTSEQIWNGIEAGLAAAKKMGAELAGAVKAAADKMECDGEGVIGHAAGSFDWDNTTGDAQINIPVEVLTIDGLAMTAVKTELCAETALTLRIASSYDHTIALTFVNGDQSYMPAASTYDEGTKVSTKSSLKRGAAEEFIRVAVQMMNGELERTNIDDAQGREEGISYEGTDAESVGQIINIGGLEWQVLAEVDGKQLVITKDVINVGPFNKEGGNCIWENSSVRDSLNGEFLNRFTDAEKARIQETVNQNKANSTYAAGAGADTTDRIFLLSMDEAAGYFADKAARVAIDPETGNTTTWWLRTTGKDTAFAATILTDGSIYAHGNLAGEADSSQSGDTYEASGVRPAMWIVK